ncbi:hypothetical protein F5883DRAFT_544336 [Diaporthe sp. PMI_573]|jgi:hypothetical protein|nr:hypothetical protein F5883DRAFT_544336 [Diaporthaceae sp. PMI_573]
MGKDVACQIWDATWALLALRRAAADHGTRGSAGYGLYDMYAVSRGPECRAQMWVVIRTLDSIMVALEIWTYRSFRHR